MSFPDLSTLRAVLALTERAPSTGDPPPWRWRIGADELNLLADHHVAGIGRRSLLLSCGAVLHHCALGLADTGWSARIRRLPDPANPNYLAAITVFPQPPTELDAMLCAAITRRHADGGAYNSWPVPWGDIALMGARAARAGAMLRQIDQLPEVWAVADDGGAVLALGTEADDDLAWLRAGEATSLVLLSATAMGLSSCPLPGPLDIPETREAVRREVFGAFGYPQMLMRMGWVPEDAEPLPLAMSCRP